MRVFIACPAPRHSRKGNRVTAERWARILEELGHQVIIGPGDAAGLGDCLLGLHARKSHRAIRAFRRQFPGRPILVALTGTDLYRDLDRSRWAQLSLEWADRIIALQSEAIRSLSRSWRKKMHIIYQSAEPTPNPPPHRPGRFDVCVLGHLRYEKDPFRCALALKRLPPDSRIQVTHAGEALSPAMERRAQQIMAREPRYHWIGEVPRGQARRLLARSRLLVLSSRMEGGANVIGEAMVDGVPVLATRIDGNVGMLGRDYAGYFPVGDTMALSRQLWRAESDAEFYERLRRACAERTNYFVRAAEIRAWERLLRELRS